MRAARRAGTQAATRATTSSTATAAALVVQVEGFELEERRCQKPRRPRRRRAILRGSRSRQAPPNRARPFGRRRCAPHRGPCGRQSRWSGAPSRRRAGRRVRWRRAQRDHAERAGHETQHALGSQQAVDEGSSECGTHSAGPPDRPPPPPSHRLGKAGRSPWSCGWRSGSFRPDGTAGRRQGLVRAAACCSGCSPRRRRSRTDCCARVEAKAAAQAILIREVPRREHLVDDRTSSAQLHVAAFERPAGEEWNPQRREEPVADACSGRRDGRRPRAPGKVHAPVVAAAR